MTLKEAVSAGLISCASVHRFAPADRQITSEMRDVWLKALAGYTPDSVAASFVFWRDNRTDFPTPAEIKARARKVSPGYYEAPVLEPVKPIALEERQAILARQPAFVREAIKEKKVAASVKALPAPFVDEPKLRRIQEALKKRKCGDEAMLKPIGSFEVME